jgi:hypothetical protein
MNVSLSVTAAGVCGAFDLVCRLDQHPAVAAFLRRRAREDVALGVEPERRLLPIDQERIARLGAGELGDRLDADCSR